MRLIESNSIHFRYFAIIFEISKIYFKIESFMINGVGIIREPSPEEMEEYFQEHLKTRGVGKTA